MIFTGWVWSRYSLALLLTIGISNTVFAETLPESTDNQHNQAKLLEQIEQMITAMESQNYSGRYFRVRGDQIEVMELTQRYIDNTRHEYLHSLNGPSKIVRRAGTDCECIWPERGEALVGELAHLSSRLSGARFAALDEHSPYRFVGLGRYRIAGHHCQQIAIVPEDALRYGYKICIGEQVPLLLRMSLYEQTGTPIEHNQFSHVFIDDQQMIATVAEDQLPLVGAEALAADYEVHTAAAVDADDFDPIDTPRFGVHNPPAGFEISSYARRTDPSGEQQFDHIVVSDGLATVSLFIEQQGQVRERRLNPGSPGMHMAQRSKDDRHITAIGDVPQDTVDLLVDSVVRVEKP